MEQKNFLEKINDLVVSFQKIKIKDKLVFYRLLATMLNAGVSIVDAVNILERQEKNEVMKHMLSDFSAGLREGKSLHECFLEHESQFNDSELGMVQTGEKTGKLNQVLLDLAEQVEKVASISGKIKSAMIYPAAILLVVFGVVFVMMTMVVPKLLEIFDDKSTLPASTKTLIAISDFFSGYWYLIILLFVGAYVFVHFWRKTPAGKYNFDAFLLQIPIFGGINRKLVLSKFSRILSGLLSSGVSIVESMRIVADAVGNEVYRQRILLLVEDVRQGIKVSDSLEWDVLFPEMMVQMMEVWEQTASLDKTIIKVADFYDEQVDNTVGVLNKLLEPFIIVLLAVIVWFIAIAIMQPIMWLADSVSNG